MPDDITTTAERDDCSLLSDYVEFELSELPELGSIGIQVTLPSPIFILVINETAPTFLEFLESTPSLFSNLSQAIDDNPGIFELQELAADFVTVVSDVCGISLSQEQIDDVTRLFDSALFSVLVLLQDCGMLSQTILETVINALQFNSATFALEGELDDFTDVEFLSDRVSVTIQNVLDAPVDEVPAAAQTALDEFLFVINDFCGIPPLSNVTLAQLEEYFLEDVVNNALSP